MSDSQHPDDQLERPQAERLGLPDQIDDVDRDVIEREVRLRQILEQPVRLTFWLLGVNVAIWLAGVVGGDLLGIYSPRANNEQLALYTGMKVNSEVWAGEWWRLLSSQFVHLDFMHILFNGYGLYVLGPIIERFYGTRRFFVLYLASGTVGAVASLLINDAASGGASGAIYGLVGALLAVGWKYRKALPERVSRAFTTGMAPWVILSLGIGFIGSIPMDNAAHLGGLFTGGLMAFVLASKLRRRRSKLTDWFIWATVLVGVGALAWTLWAWTGEAMTCLQGKDAYFACYPDMVQKLE